MTFSTWILAAMLLVPTAARAQKMTAARAPKAARSGRVRAPNLQFLRAEIAAETRAAMTRRAPLAKADRARVDALVNRMESAAALLYPGHKPAAREKALAALAEQLYREPVGRIMSGRERGTLMPLSEASAVVKRERPRPGSARRWITTPALKPADGDMVIAEWDYPGSRGFSKPVPYSKKAAERIGGWNTAYGPGSSWLTRVDLPAPVRATPLRTKERDGLRKDLERGGQGTDQVAVYVERRGTVGPSLEPPHGPELDPFRSDVLAAVY